MNLFTMTHEEFIERAKSFPLGYTLDANGYALTYRDDGFSSEYTRDTDGNKLTYRDSNGNFIDYTKDKQ